MTREIVSASLKKQVLELYNNRCYACSFSIHTILRVHHRVPVSLGGTDDVQNLVLLCPNCHALIHLLSSQRFDGQEFLDFLTSEYSREATEQIIKLSQAIRQAKQNIKRGSNIWNKGIINSQRPYSVEEAIVSVSRRNK